MTPETATEALAKLGRALPGSADERRQALDAFTSRGLPTRRDEAWRYTDLKPLAEAHFEPFTAAPSRETVEQVRARLAATAPPSDDRPTTARVVVIDGHVDRTLSVMPPVAGLEVATLSDGAALDRLPRPARLDAHPLALLNRAFAADGIAVTVAQGTDITAPIEIFIVNGRSAAAKHVRLAVDLGERARLPLIVHGLDLDDGAGWVNLLIDVRVGAGAKLTLSRLQEHGTGVFQTSALLAELDQDAELSAGVVDVGARLARNDFDVALSGKGAAAELYGVYLAAGSHADNQIRVDHAAAHTRSQMVFRGIAGERGRGVFRGGVIVRQGAQKIDAQQRSDNLLLDAHSEIDTRPELEIYADDVKCSHGATVGELDEQHMFYLRSRGLDEGTARGLLTFAFANSLLDRLPSARLRERARVRIAGRLPDSLTPEGIE